MELQERLNAAKVNAQNLKSRTAAHNAMLANARTLEAQLKKADAECAEYGKALAADLDVHNKEAQAIAVALKETLSVV